MVNEFIIRNQNELAKITPDDNVQLVVDGGTLEHPIDIRASYKNAPIILGYSYVQIWACTKVIAKGGATVFAYHYSTVQCFGDTLVIAHQNSKIRAHGESRVVAKDTVKIEAFGDSHVLLLDNAKAEVRGHAEVLEFNKTRAYLRQNGRAYLYSNTAHAFLCGMEARIVA